MSLYSSSNEMQDLSLAGSTKVHDEHSVLFQKTKTKVVILEEEDDKSEEEYPLMPLNSAGHRKTIDHKATLPNKKKEFILAEQKKKKVQDQTEIVVAQEQEQTKLIEETPGTELIDSILKYKKKMQEKEYHEAWNEGANKKRFMRFLAFGPIYLLFILFAILLLIKHSTNLHPTPLMSWTSQQPNFNLNISNCIVHIRDMDTLDGSTNSIKILEPSPWFTFDKFDIEYNFINDTVNVNLTNPFLINYCNLTIFVDSTQTIGDFSLNCSLCTIIQDSPLFNMEGMMNITGQSVSANFANLQTNAFNFLVAQGSLQLNMIHTYSPSSINFTTKGDIIVQSNSTINITKFWSPTQTFCFAGPVPTQITTKHCQVAYQNKTIGDKNCFGSGTISDGTNTVEPYQQNFTLITSSGNIYVNVIPSIGIPIPASLTMDSESNNLYFGDVYLSGISFDEYTMSEFSSFQEMSSSDSENAPLLSLNLGDPLSLSSTWNKWILASNPTYEFIKPWVISATSATLLEGFPFQVNGALLPGFCPWRPTLNVYDYLNITSYINDIKSNTSGDVAFVSSLSTQKKMNSILTYQNSSGIHSLVNDWVPWGDHWYTLSINNYGMLDIDQHVITDNIPVFLAVLLSIFCSFLLGLFLLNIFIYIINYYSYMVISKGARQSNYIRLKKLKSTEKADDIKLLLKQQDEYEETKADKLKPPKRTLNPITNFIYLKKNFIFISTFIDYVIVTISRSGANSIDSFLNIMFSDKALLDEEEIISDEKKEIIHFHEFRNLYQEYCFLTHLEENRMGPEILDKRLKSRGFFVDRIEDSASISYCGVMFKDISSLKLSTADNEFDGLSLFMKHAVEKTNFKEDQIEASHFVTKYDEFCKFFRVHAVVLTPQILKQKYNIDTVNTPIHVIRKNPSKKTDYFIDRKKLDNFMKYLNDDTLSLTNDEMKAVRAKLFDTQGFGYELLAIFLQYLFVILLAFPLVFLVVIMNTAYSPYTVKSTFYLLDWQSFYYQPSTACTHIPFPIQCFIIFITILNGLDLAFYIKTMERPIESYFKTDNWAKHTCGRYVAFCHWVIVLILLLLYFSYVFLVMTWTLLGAIINPNYLLPYASATFTFLLFAMMKYTHFTKIIEKGKDAILVLIEQSFKGHVTKILVKLGINLMCHENETLSKAKEISSSHHFHSTTSKLVETGVLLKEDVEGLKKKVDDLEGHDLNHDIIKVAESIANQPDYLKSEFDILSFKIENQFIAKIKADLKSREVSEELIEIIVSHTVKQMESLKYNIQNFLKKSNKDVPESMRSFLSEIMFPSSATAKDENIKFLAKKLINCLIQKLNGENGPNAEVTSRLVEAYYALRAFDKKNWNSFSDSMNSIIKNNRAFSKLKKFNKNSMKLILSTLNLLLELIRKNSSKKDTAEKIIQFIRLIKQDQMNDHQILVKEIGRRDTKEVKENNDENIIDEGDKTNEKNDKLNEKDGKYVEKCFVNICESIIFLVTLLKNEDLIWDHTDQRFASTNYIFRFSGDSVVILPDQFSTGLSKNDILAASARQKIGAVTNISLGIMRNDMPNIHQQAISLFNKVYNLKFMENDRKLSDDYIRFIIDLLSVSMTNPEEFMQQAFNYVKEEVSDSWKEFIVYSLGFKYKSTLTRPLKISEENKNLVEFLKKGNLKYEHFLGLIEWISDQGITEETKSFLDSVIICLNIFELEDRIKEYLQNSIILLMTQKHKTASICISNLKLPLKKFILVGKGILPLQRIKESDFRKLIKECKFKDPNEGEELFKRLIEVGKDYNFEDWRTRLFEVLEDYYREKNTDHVAESETNSGKKSGKKPKKLDLINNPYRNFYATLQKLYAFLHMEPDNQEDLRKVLTALSAYALTPYNRKNPEDGEILKLLRTDNLLRNLLTVISLKSWMDKNGEYSTRADKRMAQSLGQFALLVNIDYNFLRNLFQLFFINNKKIYEESLFNAFGEISQDARGFADYAYQKVESLKYYANTLLNKLPDVILWTEKSASNAQEKLNIELPLSWYRDLSFGHNNELDLTEIPEAINFINTIMKTSPSFVNLANKFESSKLSSEIMFLSKLFKGFGSEQNAKKSITENLLTLMSTVNKPAALAKILGFFQDHKNPICISLTLYGIFKGWGELNAGHNLSYKQLAAKQLNIKSEFFDIFEAILKRDVKSFVDHCTKLIKIIKGDTHFDKEFIISIISFLNGRQYNFSPLAGEMGCPSDVLEFIVALYSLRNTADRSNIFREMDSSVVIQNILKQLDVDSKEFTHILRLIFSEYDEEMPMKTVLKAIDPKGFVDPNFIKGLNEIYHNSIDTDEEIKEFNTCIKNNENFKNKLNPLFDVLGIDASIGHIIVSLRRGNFLLFETQVQDFEWVFGTGQIDFHTNKIKINDAGHHLLYLTAGLTGLVNNTLEFNKFPQHNVISKANTLEYALELVSRQLIIDTKWLRYGLLISNNDMITDADKFTKSSQNLLRICLLNQAMESFPTQKDIMGLNDWHAGMIYFFKYDLNNLLNEKSYLKVLDNTNDSLKTITMDLFQIDQFSKIRTLLSKFIIANDISTQDKFNEILAIYVLNEFDQIKSLRIFEEYINETYSQDTIQQFNEKWNDFKQHKLTSIYDMFQYLDLHLETNRAYILLVKCLIPYIYEKLIYQDNGIECSNGHTTTLLQRNNLAFLNLSIISGIMNIRNIENDDKNYAYNIFYLNILMTNIERKLIFIYDEMAKLYRKLNVMKIVGLGRGLIVSNAFEVFLSPPVFDIIVLKNLKFFGYKSIKHKEPETLKKYQQEAEEFFETYVLKELNYCNDPSRLIHYGYKCHYCMKKAKKTGSTFDESIRGLRYKCKECESFDLCTNCVDEISELLNKQQENGKKQPKSIRINGKEHKSNHPLFDISTSLDRLSINHIIRTYHCDDASYSYNTVYGDELYGEICKKKSWTEMRFGNLDIRKVILFDPKEFSNVVNNLKQRIYDYEAYSDLIHPIIDENHKENQMQIALQKITNPILKNIAKDAINNNKSCFIGATLLESSKTEERILLYPSYDIKYQKILRRIEDKINNNLPYEVPSEEIKKNKEENTKFDEKYTDLRTNIPFRRLDAKLKDFERSLMKPNTKMLLGLFEDDYDFNNRNARNFLTDKGVDSRAVYQLVIGLIGLKRRGKHSTSIHSLFQKAAYLSSDQKIIEGLLGFLMQKDNSKYLEFLRGPFELSQDAIDIFVICDDYNYYKAANINNQTTSEYKNFVPKQTWNCIKSLSKRIESPEIVALLHAAYNLNLGAWEELARRLSITGSKPNQIMNLIKMIDFKALNDYLTTPTIQHTTDFTEIPDIIAFSEKDARVRTDFIPTILMKTYEDLEMLAKNKDGALNYTQKIAYFICRAFNRMLECPSGNKDNRLMKLFTTDYRNNTQETYLYNPNDIPLDDDDIAGAFMINYNALIKSFSSFQIYNENEIIEQQKKEFVELKLDLPPEEIIQMRKFAWLTYIKHDNFDNLEQKFRYANGIFKVVGDPDVGDLSLFKDNVTYKNPEAFTEEKAKQRYLLAYIAYIKWDVELFLSCLDEKTVSYPIISSLYLLLNWNRVFASIYLDRKEEFDKPIKLINNDQSDNKGPDIAKTEKSMKKYFSTYKKVIDHEIKPLIDYCSIVFKLALANIHGSKNPIENDDVQMLLGKVPDNIHKIKDYLARLEAIPLDGIMEGDHPHSFNSVLVKMRSKIVQMQAYERWKSIYNGGMTINNDVNKDKKDEISSAQIEENKDNDDIDDENNQLEYNEDEFSKMIKKLFCLEDFYLLNFDKLIYQDTKQNTADWIHFNNYIIMAEHYNSTPFFSSTLKQRISTLSSSEDNSNVNLKQHKINENIMQMLNLARDLTNKIENNKQRDLLIYSDMVILMLRKLCVNIPEEAQKTAKGFIKDIIKLFSAISGYNFLECFDEECVGEAKTHCKYCTNGKLDHVASHISKIINKNIINQSIDDLTLSSTAKSEWFNELIPIMVGIYYDSETDIWGVPEAEKVEDQNQDIFRDFLHDKDSDDDDESDSDSDNDEHIECLSENQDELGVNDNGGSPEKNPGENAGHELVLFNKKTVKLAKYKEFQNELFKLMEVLSIKLGQAIHDDKMMIDQLREIFKSIDIIFLKTCIDIKNPSHTNLDKETAQLAAKYMNKIGRVAISLYNLKLGNDKDIEVLIEYDLNDRDKSKNVISYIEEMSKIIDMENFKAYIRIIPKQKKSAAIETVKLLFNKIKNGKTTEYDLFKICDALGDGSGTISQEEFLILARRLGTPLTRHRVQEIFTEIKGYATSPEDMDLNEEEFVQALHFIKEKQLKKALVFMGITPQMMYGTLAYLLFVLFLIFIFIFLGIQAFAIGGSFSAVVNSALPALSAFSLGGKDEEEEKVDEKKVHSACEKSKSVVMANDHEKEEKSEDDQLKEYKLLNQVNYDQ